MTFTTVLLFVLLISFVAAQEEPAPGDNNECEQYDEDFKKCEEGCDPKETDCDKAMCASYCVKSIASDDCHSSYIIGCTFAAAFKRGLGGDENWCPDLDCASASTISMSLTTLAAVMWTSL
mmetsp:Transcript_20169/g.34463  ORF Transcript_20169/g.34463 Transcript_20169/m.34463 type:complete len:121 (-) Transcript_20169:51-413(-)